MYPSKPHDKACRWLEKTILYALLLYQLGCYYCCCLFVPEEAPQANHHPFRNPSITPHPSIPTKEVAEFNSYASGSDVPCSEFLTQVHAACEAGKIAR